jgi:hyperosmotically inducible protein
MTRKFRNALLAGLLIALPAVSSAAVADAELRTQAELIKKVRKELVMLPYYGVFDNFAFRVDDSIVTLMGSVTRPTLKSSAENVVKRIEGVTAVVNQIEVLPLSSFDDRIRIAVLRSIYGSSNLSRYGLGAQPSIRIIVKRGEVTLEGVVNNEADRNIAFIRANGVAGVFKVTNNLRLDKTA